MTFRRLVVRVGLFFAFGLLILEVAYWVQIHSTLPFAQDLVGKIAIPVFSGVFIAGVSQLIQFPVTRKHPQLLVRRRDLRLSTRRVASDRPALSAGAQWFGANEQLQPGVQHPLLNQISRRILSVPEGVFLLEGPPASGKTHLLRSVEDEIDRRKVRGRRVYSFQFKDHNSNDVQNLLQDLEGIQRHSIVLLDDIHTHLLQFVNLLHHLPTGLIIVATTRPLASLPAQQAAALSELVTDRYEIRADAVADALVRRHFEAVQDSDCADQANVREQFQDFRTDLWILTTALEAHRSSGIVSRTAILRWINENLLEPVTVEGDIVSRAEFLAPLAALSKFEVSADRAFLVDGLGLDQACLHRLEEMGEIEKTAQGEYRLHHSSVAQLIVETLSSQVGAAKVPRKIQESAREYGVSWVDVVPLLQINAVPVHSALTITRLIQNGVGGEQTAARLLPFVSPQVLLEGLAVGEVDSEILGALLYAYCRSSSLLPEEISSQLGVISARIPVTNAPAVAWLCSNVAQVAPERDAEYAELLARAVSAARPSLGADMLTTVSYASSDLASRASETLDPARMADGLTEEALSPLDLARVVAKFSWVNPGLGSRLAIHFKHVFSAADIGVLPLILARIGWGSPKVASDLAGSLDESQLATALQSEPNELLKYRFVAALANVSPDAAKRIQSRVSGASAAACVRALQNAQQRLRKPTLLPYPRSRRDSRSDAECEREMESYLRRSVKGNGFAESLLLVTSTRFSTIPTAMRSGAGRSLGGWLTDNGAPPGLAQLYIAAVGLAPVRDT